MATTFPISPSTGQKFTNGNKVWTWDGNSWKGGVTSGGDAGTLDNIDSGSFLRSDAADSFSGTLSGAGSINITGTVTAASFTGALSGNAATVTNGVYKNTTNALSNSLWLNSSNDVSTLAGSLTLYSSSNATTSMMMFKNTTGLNYGNHGAITGTYNTYFVMDTTNRGWVFRNATTSANVASISNTGVITSNSGIKLGDDTRTASTAGAGSLKWNASLNVLQNSDGTNWTDVSMSPTVSTTAPSSPSVGDMWFDTTIGVTAMKVWAGAAWDQMSNKFSATGGTVSTSGAYKYHTFTSSGTFTAEASGTVDIMMVAGGGGGGWYVGGGGGAGGMIESMSKSVTAQTYSIIIGAGASVTGSSATSPSGSNTTGLGLTSIGGGGGGTYPNNGGNNGGSGGGAGGCSGTFGVARQSGTSGQGNTGGTSLAARGGNPTTGSGGGGANGAGGDYPGVGSTSRTTDGGAGKVSAVCPSGYYYAGGGGGGAYNAGATIYAGNGGIGGGGGGAAYATGVGSGGGSARNAGGTGASGNDANGGSGGQNTGGGSGGGGHYMLTGNNGGSGIVIIRYAI